MAMPSGRFFGWVIGGTLPAALAADWLVSAWDQNTGMRYATPGATGVEEVAAAWLLDLLGLPPDVRRRVRHRRDDGQLHRARGRPAAGADPRRLGPRRRRPHRRPPGDRAGGRRPARLGRRRAALPRPGSCRPRWRPTSRAASVPDALAAALAEVDGPTDRGAAGGQPALGGLRPVRRVHRPGARARRLGARRRCLRAVGGGGTDAAHPGRAASSGPTRGPPTRTRR